MCDKIIVSNGKKRKCKNQPLKGKKFCAIHSKVQKGGVKKENDKWVSEYQYKTKEEYIINQLIKKMDEIDDDYGAHSILLISDLLPLVKLRKETFSLNDASSNFIKEYFKFFDYYIKNADKDYKRRSSYTVFDDDDVFEEYKEIEKEIKKGENLKHSKK